MNSKASRVSIIIPTLNEAERIVALLEALASLRTDDVEIIVADGGSRDSTVRLATGLATHVIVAGRGRARQMNAGAQVATGSCLLFLHADTRLPANAIRRIRSRRTEQQRIWGRFDVRITGRHPMLQVVASLMNLRSRLTGIATGDQAIFVERAAFDKVGGYPDQPLMEDIELSRRLRRLGRPACLRDKVTTSGRRWESHGVWRTIVLMWRLRAAYALGADPRTLAERYGYGRAGD